ncbi:MAG TPA: choice-of-anchor D domain-containing protein [bacterium]|nr:choice-of-anchor D domain-containing protein [bacterium]HPN46098.1 choice-of-anchor D domain-containing protein [bacterium]
MGKFCSKILWGALITLTFSTLVRGQTHFLFTPTEDYYSIIVSQATIAGQPLQNGDEIGVFYDNGSAMVCAGAVVWPNNGISAWGDDSQTTAKDGFATGDLLVFKIWESGSASNYDDVNATFSTGNGTWGNGIYAQVSLDAVPYIPIGPDLDVQDNVHSFNFGNITVGLNSSHTFVIQNEGDASLDISSIDIGGTNATDFSISSGGGTFSVAAGSDHNLGVQFTPAAAGAKTATLTIYSNDPDENPWQIILSGSGETVLPHYNFAATEDYYSIVINNVTINDLPLQNGDEIGVFFDNGSTLVCAGAVIWPDYGLNAWGDDSQTNDKDGFIAGEYLVFKIWDASASTEYTNINALYLYGDGTWGNGVFAQVNLHNVPVAINTTNDTRPIQFDLLQNYPNPFNPQTTIEYSLPETADVQVEVFNITGQKICTLVNEKLQPGYYRVVWDGTNDRSETVSAGIYYLILKAGNYTQTKKMAFIK